MTPSQEQIFRLSTLLQLEKEVRHAQTPAELGFIMVNETLKLISYQQAIFWLKTPTGKISIQAISGADQPDKYSPFIIYLRNLIQALLRQSGYDKECQTCSLAKKDPQEWTTMGQAAIWSPLITPRKEMIGGLLLIRDAPWNDHEIRLIERLSDTYAHSWKALNPGRLRLHLSTPKRLALQCLIFLIIIAVMFLPVRLSVLAPVEIVPFEPNIISVPMDGMIRQIHVRPNQKVASGQLLFNLDDTLIQSNYEIARNALGLIQAEYDLNQKMLDEKSNADMAVLKAQIAQKSAEVDYLAKLLERSKIYAEQDGIALFSDVNDWLGKPVTVGEKVMSIIHPDQVEAEIYLPVADAISLDPGTEVRIFLNIKPHASLLARLRQASYEAHVTSEGILAFCLKASLMDSPARIGLRGTAKIYGKEVTLFYYLMRRPLSALRQRLGW